MALVAPQATDRKLPKALVGDFAFARFAFSRGPPSLLFRNIRQTLAHHEEKFLCDISFNPRPQPQHFSLPAADPSTNGQLQTDTSKIEAKPLVEAASSKALVVRTMEPSFENISRRSVRRLQEAVHHNDDAELFLDLVSIRKKLNFAKNRPGDERPRKKTKSGHLKCLCSVTIWDNRAYKDEKDEEKEPLIKQHTNCTIITFETDERIPNVSIQLDEPFRLRAKDLKVSLTKGSGEIVRGIIDDYFLELKLIPTKSDVDWPPIPVLGKSDGDSQRGIAALSAEKLKGALVARYQKLPQAPEANVPLSVFFIHEGRLHKTKFGLELNAQWSVSKAATHEHSPEVRAKLPGSSWTVDSSGNSFGRQRIELPNRTKKSSASPTSNGVPTPASSTYGPKVKVSYCVDPDSAKTHDIAKSLRTVEVDGFRCPMCVSFRAKDDRELRFHLVMMHGKYNFVLVSDNDVENSRTLLFHIVPVHLGKSRKDPGTEKQFEYFANRAPFNISTFLNGDRSWTRETKQRSKAPKKTTTTMSLVDDPATVLRRQNGGRLAPKDVRDFRKPERKKYRVVHLDRKYDDKRTPYSSISHRPRSISEDAMSETDDEMDDEWFVERHLENLDNLSKKEMWSELKTEVIRRWNKHRLEEKQDHPRYLSDSLVRFVRKEKEILRSQDPGMQAAVSDLLADLMRNRFINVQFCAEIRAMIFDDSEEPKKNQDVAMADVPQHEKIRPPAILKPVILEQQASRLTTGQTAGPVDVWKKQLLALPKSSCGVCTKTIIHPHKEAIHCSNHDCPVAGAVFHLKCVEQKAREREWKCHGCKVLAKVDKGKARAVD